jgi:hypothetical protein
VATCAFFSIRVNFVPGPFDVALRPGSPWDGDFFSKSALPLCTLSGVRKFWSASESDDYVSSNTYL